MNFQLDYFRQIIYTIKDGLNPEKDQIAILSEIKEEIFRVTIKIDTYQADSICGLTAFVHLQLGSLSRMAKEIEDTLVDFQDLSPDSKKLLETILIGIEDIIRHILIYMPDHFDYNISLTQKTRVFHLEQHKARLNEILLLLKNSCIDQVLIEILTDTIMLSIAESPNFLHLRFSEGLMDYLHQHKNKQLSVENLTKMLITWKYNHPRFFDFYTGAITKKLGESSSVSDHFRELIFLKKQILQTPVEDSGSYCQHLPPISESILRWIDSELEFMKQLDFLNSELMNSGILDSTYKVSLSVKQLAYLIYLAVEVGIITERKAKRVHQYVISHVSTVETEKISEKSFSNGYYVPSPGDISKVSDKLANMLALSQNHY
jgi:hypothetical protein